MKARMFFAALAAVGIAVATFGERLALDEGWTFTLEGHEPRQVNIPHDWSIEFAPYATAPTEYGGGFYRAGKATYERKIELSDEDLNKSLSLLFEGVYRDATVFVNGVEAGRGTFYGYTGFEIPLEGKVHAGENTLKVEVDNSAQPNCRWYSGCGIIRPVYLIRQDLQDSQDLSQSCKSCQSCQKNSAPLRDIKWSANEGLSIDGTNVLLHGACVHHDHGPLGAAAWPEAELRKVRLLKAAGFNAVRCSHNPASEAFLDACDAEGLWVVQELCDGWREKKNKHDYGEVFEEDWEKDLRWMVERDKHHPCIIAWSIGNEILERTSPWAAEQAEKMVALCHELDPSRPVLEALCAWRKGEWTAQDAMAAKLDIVGYNYMEKETERDHERCPGRVIVYTETYPRDATNTWRRITKHPYVIGEFVWTGIDYLGESTIGRTYYEGKEPGGEHYKVANKGFPWHGAYCGDIDLTGWRKPISHLRETLWNEAAPTYMCVREPDGWRGKIKTTLWSVWPQHEHWNFDGWEGKPVTVEVYTRKRHVELYLNGRKVGEADVSAATAWTATFKVPYEPGEIVVLAGEQENNSSDSPVLLQKEKVCLRTAGEPKEVRYSVERIGRLEFVTAEVVDGNGVLCPWADWEIEFEGNVIATCSADLRDTHVATSHKRKAWHGRALGIRKVAPSKLYEDFVNPPPEVKVGCYYYWVNERVDPVGVRKDLEWMKSVGITRAFLCTDIRNRYRAEEPFGAADELIGDNEFWSEKWWNNLRTALKVAGELGIEMGLFNCPGWSQSGGPWIKPEEAMRDYVGETGDREHGTQDREEKRCWEVCHDKFDGLRSNGPCSPKATGLEVDKLSAKHVRKHFDSFIGEILRRIPAEERPTLTTVVIDSWERGTQNYTDDIFERFKARFGYDLDYSRGKCQKDLKMLLAELVASEYIGTMTECAHENGLITWCEPYAHSPTIMDGVSYGAAADEVGAEFWAGEPKNERTKEVNNALRAARRSGKNKVYAESFTAGRWERHAKDDWSFETLKPYADKFFHKGINATILHVVISQPGDDTEPPVRPWFGTFFDRRSKNAADTKRLVDYCRRCNFMLQLGRPHDGKTDERILDDGTIIRFTPDSLFEVTFPDGRKEIWNPEQPNENCTERR